MSDACPRCGCSDPGGGRAHLLQSALVADDLDRAMNLGLLDDAIACTACNDDCRGALADARQARQQALAARERFRARNARLARRERERAERRKPASAAGPLPGAAATAAASLPPAAAAALARAKALAAARRKP